jgi:hypothetical protein
MEPKDFIKNYVLFLLAVLLTSNVFFAKPKVNLDSLFQSYCAKITFEVIKKYQNWWSKNDKQGKENYKKVIPYNEENILNEDLKKSFTDNGFIKHGKKKLAEFNTLINNIKEKYPSAEKEFDKRLFYFSLGVKEITMNDSLLINSEELNNILYNQFIIFQRSLTTPPGKSVRVEEKSSADTTKMENGKGILSLLDTMIKSITYPDILFFLVVITIAVYYGMKLKKFNKYFSTINGLMKNGEFINGKKEDLFLKKDLPGFIKTCENELKKQIEDELNNTYDLNSMVKNDDTLRKIIDSRFKYLKGIPEYEEKVEKETIYFPQPNIKGYFEDSLRQSSLKSSSTYKMELDPENKNRGLFSVVNDKMTHEFCIRKIDTILTPVCEFRNYRGEHIEIIEEGIAELENGKWKVNPKDKCKIRIY